MILYINTIVQTDATDIKTAEMDDTISYIVLHTDKHLMKSWQTRYQKCRKNNTRNG